MHGIDSFMVKNALLSLPIPEKQPYVYQWSLIFIFHKLLSGDIKLSDLEYKDSYLPITALIMSKLNFLLITTMKHET